MTLQLYSIDGQIVAQEPHPARQHILISQQLPVPTPNI